MDFVKRHRQGFDIHCKKKKIVYWQYNFRAFTDFFFYRRNDLVNVFDEDKINQWQVTKLPLTNKC